MLTRSTNTLAPAATLRLFFTLLKQRLVLSLRGSPMIWTLLYIFFWVCDYSFTVFIIFYSSFSTVFHRSLKATWRFNEIVRFALFFTSPFNSFTSSFETFLNIFCSIRGSYLQHFLFSIFRIVLTMLVQWTALEYNVGSGRNIGIASPRGPFRLMSANFTIGRCIYDRMSLKRKIFRNNRFLVLLKR